jgi:hypothetical protein
VAVVCAPGDVCDADEALRSRASVLPILGVDPPRRYDLGGVSVAVFALDPQRPDAAAPARALEDARAAVGPTGRLVAVVPAPADYGSSATTAERLRARALVDRGVDAVVGIGGYAAKEVERYGRGVIAYSLGALLRPPTMALAELSSSGIGLRLELPAAGELRADVVPLTYDDQGRAALARPSTGPGNAAGLLPIDALEQARADADGVDLGPFQPGARTAAAPLERWALARHAAVGAWFPIAPAHTALRPFDGAFLGASAYVARRGVAALGVSQRAVELDPGNAVRVSVRYPAIRVAGRLAVAYAVPDDRLRSKMVPLRDQTLTIALGERTLLAQAVRYRAGWSEVVVETGGGDATMPMTISLAANGTHFPVAVHLRALDAVDRRRSTPSAFVTGQ